ncbi:MAG: DUF2946 family protein [Burkholderiales bacterium]|nr:DUF2946 family protein [Burkholderiales bacterium]
MKSLRLTAVWLLLLALPLQGLAAYTPSARCADSPGSGHAAYSSPQNQHHAASQAHDHSADQQQHDDGQPEDKANGHSCCHHVFSGAPSAAIPGMPAPPNALTPRVSLLFTLYIPELPQRPPRA